jgi:plasmid stabilization system protein ParE
MRISLSVEAEADADAATDWYLGYGAFVAAEDFANAIERAFALLCDYPEMGASAAHGTRMLTLQDFPYSVIYRVQGEEIRVIAVAHHSRRPGYWVGRR